MTDDLLVDNELLSGGEKTDLSHPIQGFDPGIDRGGHAPELFSHIEGNLVMGGVPRGRAPAWAHYIVSLYPWEPYELLDHQVFVQARLFDSLEIPPVGKLEVLAQTVNAFRDRGPTLVHCQAGWNRSGLVTALALMMRGRTAEQAIALLRDKRCQNVLCNQAFELWLRSVTIEGVE